MIYNGILLNEPYYITSDKMFTFNFTEEQTNLIADFLQEHIEDVIPVHITILKNNNGNYEHIQDIEYIDTSITYREPYIPAGEEDYWYLLITNNPSHLQIRSSGMLVIKIKHSEADESTKILLTDFSQEQCEQYNIPYTEIEV